MHEPVRYTIDLTHRRQHLVTVSVVVPKDCASGATVALPCWTPGSYLRRDYIRHLQHISATDSNGKPVALTPVEGDTWQLADDVSTAVTVTMELFAHEASVRTNMVDATQALIIPAATCLNVVAATNRQHRVTFTGFGRNHSVYSLLPSDPNDPGTFIADDYHHLVDGAFTCGQHTAVSVTIDTVPHTFVWSAPAEQFDKQVVVDTLQKVAPACAEVFATPLQTPQYTVLTLTGAGGSGGLEHRDGVVLHVPDSTFTTPESVARFQSLLAHEYFHAWNVKRLIPKNLTTLTYDTVRRTTSLWFAEGFTAYYDSLICVRTGLWDPDRFLARIGRVYTDLTQTPGVTRQSLQDASWRAPERQYRRDENAANAMTEYYAHGSLVALELDALLRGEQPDGDGLDLVMRLLWQRHRDTGYTDDDIFGAIAEVSNDTIASRIKSRVSLPGLGDRNEFADALSNLGLTLTSTQPPAGWLGVQLAGHTPTVGVRLAATLRDGPAWAAGLTGNDTLLAINDTVVTADTFNQIVEQHQPGETVNVRVLRHNRIDAVPLTLAHCPATFTVTATTNATALARGSYARWLKLPPG